MQPADVTEAETRAIEWKPTHIWKMGANLAAAICSKQGASRVGARAVAAGMESTGSGGAWPSPRGPWAAQ